MIKENLENVHRNIITACKKVNRNPNEVTLVNVSKTKPVSMIRESIECNEFVFGENKVQELCNKIEELDNVNIKWNMIGHLQTNKVKYIVGKVDLIHSVDSIKLAKQISVESVKKNVVTNFLIEVNVANEDSKYGLPLEKVYDFIEEASILPNIKICGLMTVAPYTKFPEENRIIFKKLYNLYVDISQKKVDNVAMCVLSMGMTGDYEIAIEEGATMIRVGTGIFGTRNYNIKE